MFDKLKKKAETTKEKATLIPKANFGDAQAQARLGAIYDNENNGPEAIKWFTKAANNGKITCAYRLGYLYYFGYLGAYKTKEETIDYDEAFKWFKRGSEATKADERCWMLHYLGLCYFLGQGTEPDYYEAAKIFLESWNYGYRDDFIACGLGECYLFGQGVDKNVSQAVYWYKKAVNESGHSYDNGIKELNREKAQARLRELGY